MTNELITTFKSIIYQEMHESHGNWSTVEYCDLILNIILIIYLSNEFNEIYLELINEREGFEEDPFVYSMYNLRYLPPQSRWDNIMGNIENKDIKETFYNAVDYLKHSNPSLKDIVRPFAIFKINEFALKTFLYIFKDFISDNDFENELWIKIYKSFLTDFVILNEEYNLLIEKIDNII